MDDEEATGLRGFEVLNPKYLVAVHFKVPQGDPEQHRHHWIQPQRLPVDITQESLHGRSM